MEIAITVQKAQPLGETISDLKGELSAAIGTLDLILGKLYEKNCSCADAVYASLLVLNDVSGKLGELYEALP